MNFNEHDKRMSKLQNAMLGMWIVSSLIGLTVFGFVAWVIIKILAHNGVI